MKRKYLSVFSAILSIAVGLTFLLLAAVLLVRALNAKEYVPTGDANLWLIRVLQRLKAAGFNIFFSIMGIVLSSILALYRFTLAYFYFKVSKSEGAFYKARIGEIIFFSVLSGFVVGVTAWLCLGGKGILPVEVQPFILILFLAYILLCSLPVAEIGLVYLAKVIRIKPKQVVPTRKDIMQELDELADKTAMDFVKKHTEKEAETPSVSEIKPVTQLIKEVVLPRVRRVAEYAVSFWDKDDAVSEQIKAALYTKTGIRKKNRKPSYNDATLRIKKPISHKKRLKMASPAKFRLRYQKVYRYGRCRAQKRK